MNKINFFFPSNLLVQGDKQAEVSRLLREYLSSGKNFFVSFGSDKTSKQFRGFYRICGVLAPYFAESEGVLFDKDMVKEYIKQECNFVNIVKGHKISRSLKTASVKEMKALIEKSYEIGAFFDAKGYELTSEEKKAMNEYYKLVEND